ncbi:heparin lyase I family protein [uncultured Shewanella sp.]|uniref:heparin lyase I family protein n=1 Tax=uncultured Shewanella sp. TaxID=173975 RepID=UPI002630D384|nr:heparin lyase I family protein [uncultured Shewanella sp.]
MDKLGMQQYYRNRVIGIKNSASVVAVTTLVALILAITLIGSAKPSLAESALVQADNSVISTGIWHENFDEQSLDKWSYILHPQGISIRPKPNPAITSALPPTSTSAMAQDYAALIEITGEQSYLWRGIDALNRVELQHKPAYTREGQTTIVSWQFMLPNLFSDDTHQIAYWESDKTYRQSYRLQLNGARMSLVSNIAKTVVISDQPETQNVQQALWQFDDIKTNVWYTVKLATLWSMNKGHIQVSLDNQQQVDLTLQTLVASNENMFVQLGVLRERSERVESIWLDDVKVSHF